MRPAVSRGEGAQDAAGIEWCIISGAKSHKLEKCGKHWKIDFFLGCDSLTTWASCDHMLTPAWGQFSIYVCIQSWVLILGSSTPHEESNMLFSCITPWDREPTKASLGHYCSLLCIARCAKNPNEGPNNTGSAASAIDDSFLHRRLTS